MTTKLNSSTPSCFDCGNQATERLREMFVYIGGLNRIALGQKPVGWPVFRSDAAPTSADLKTRIGVGLKVFGVPGRKAFGDGGDTADFIMQNFPIFFVAAAKEMCEFTYAGVVEGDYPGYLKRDPKLAQILNAMQKIEGSALTATYWAILPFLAGGGRYVKYRLDPEIAPEDVPNYAANYLAQDFATWLRRQEYRLMAQRRTNPATMSLDKASVEWPERESPFIHVATLVLSKQDVRARGQVEYGQSLAFNIFRVPPEQAPAPLSPFWRRRNSSAPDSSLSYDLALDRGVDRMSASARSASLRP